MSRMRRIFWYLIGAPGADVEVAPQTFPGPETASCDDIIAAVAEEAELTRNSRVLIKVDGCWADVHTSTGPPSGDLTLEIVGQPAGGARLDLAALSSYRLPLPLRAYAVMRFSGMFKYTILGAYALTSPCIE